MVTWVSSGKPAAGVNVRLAPSRFQLPAIAGDRRGRGEPAAGTPDSSSRMGRAPLTLCAPGPGVTERTLSGPCAVAGSASRWPVTAPEIRAAAWAP